MATLLSAEQIEPSPRAPVEIEVPASTAWPLALAFGFTLMFAGLLTSASVGVLGVVLAAAGCVGWFREVFPHEHEETVPVVSEEIYLTTERRTIERSPVLANPPHRRGCLPAIRAAPPRSTLFLSCRHFRDCFRPARPCLHSCRLALR